MNTDILISTIRDDESGTQRESLPSFYEIILVDQIDNMLKPAFRQFLDVALDSFPVSMIDFIQAIREYWEELYDIIILVVQIQLIRHQGATLAERVYGLQRRGINHSVILDADKYGKPIIASSNKMMRWQQDISIFMVAVLPRIVTTLTRTASIVRSQMRMRQQLLHARARNAARRGGRPTVIAREATGSVSRMMPMQTEVEAVEVEEELNEFSGPYRLTGNDWRSFVSSGASYLGHALGRGMEKLGEATAVAVPYAVAGCGAIVTAQRLRYLFGYSPYHHPILGFARTALVRRNADLHDVVPPGRVAAAREAKSNIRGDYRLLTLVSLIIVLKVMHWTTQQEESNDDAITVQPLGFGSGSTADNGAGGTIDDILPPPPPPSVGRGQVVPSTDPALKQESCPLCKRTPRISECASTGGYLFCFSCLLESLRFDEARGDIPRCPVTGIPCYEKDIIMMHAGGG